jgi:hypothetical protein
MFPKHCQVFGYDIMNYMIELISLFSFDKLREHFTFYTVFKKKYFMLKKLIKCFYEFIYSFDNNDRISARTFLDFVVLCFLDSLDFCIERSQRDAGLIIFLAPFWRRFLSNTIKD